MSETPAKILVVDDDPGMRRAMDRILSPLYSVKTADGFERALEMLQGDGYEVALVDIRLGDGDGYALCERIRNQSPSTDVILITGSISQPDEKLYRSLEGDAFYFLFKPFERRVLRALVDRCVRLRQERRAKEEFAEALAEDLANARRFQRSLQPAGMIEAAGWRVAGRFEPCDAVGGDFWAAVVERDRNLVVAIADIVGHGVSAAMYAGMLRSTLDAARRADPAPAAVQEALVQGIDFFEHSNYASLFYAQLLRGGAVRYFNAGHPPALWQRASGGTSQLGATSLLLSRVFSDQPREWAEIEAQIGDRILLYSDGASEVRSPSEEELDFEGLQAVLEKTRGLDLSTTLQRIGDRVFEHAAGRPLEDDVTLVLLEREA